MCLSHRLLSPLAISNARFNFWMQMMSFELLDQQIIKIKMKTTQQEQKQQANPNRTPKSNGTLLLIAEFISIAFGFYLANCFFIKNTLNLQNFIPIPVDFNKQDKLQLILFSAFLFGTIQFCIAVTIISFRFLLLKGDPVNHQDPLIIRTLNRAMQNSIEWGVMFYPAFAYFLYYKSSPHDWELCKKFALTFVFARIVHTAGYLFSLVGASTGRAAGVVLSMTCTLGVIGLNVGVDTFFILRLIPI